MHDRTAPITLPNGVQILPPDSGGKGHADSQNPGSTAGADAAAEPTFPWTSLLILGALMLLYTGSPLDLIPDFIPILGQADDLVVGGGLFALMVRSIFKFLARKAAYDLKAHFSRKDRKPVSLLTSLKSVFVRAK